jgi:maltooligosyltrehalose trehalohydrolase
LYFVSHSDAGLIAAVREGRRREFAAFSWMGEVPDPQAPETFRRSLADWSLQRSGKHRVLYELYRELIRIRKRWPVIQRLEPLSTTAMEDPPALTVVHRQRDGAILLAFHFGSEPAAVEVPADAGRWRKVIDSSDSRWLGTGSTARAEVDVQVEARISVAAKSFCVWQARER